MYNNKILKDYAINHYFTENNVNPTSDKIIHHFPGGPGVYQHKIDQVDKNISNIKIEKKEVNNYYTQKKEEIKTADKKQIDSLFKIRYNF